MKDYNSAGFLAFVLIGVMLVVVGLLLLSDTTRPGEAQIAQHANPVGMSSRPAPAASGTEF